MEEKTTSRNLFTLPDGTTVRVSERENVTIKFGPNTPADAYGYKPIEVTPRNAVLTLLAMRSQVTSERVA